jgi:hypothetical protein
LKLREGAIVAVSLVGLIALQLAATDSSYLLQKYFWTDEFCTYTLITDPDFGHAFHALRGAVDINPPGLHILLLAFTKLVGSTSEVALRSCALFTMVVALLGIYAALREGFGVLEATAATLTVWAHPLILDHAFEIRYYGPWLAAAVWFCVLSSRARSRGLSWAGTIALAVTAFFLCTIHYFGIVTLLIIVGAQWVWRRDGRFSLAARAAIAVGPLATAAAVVFLLPYQRVVTTVSTWIPAPSVARIVDFGMTVFLPLHLGAIVMVMWCSHLSDARGHERKEEASSSTNLALIGLTSLALLVPALVGFSYLIQSVLIGRYGLPAVAALAPAVAFAIVKVSKPWQVVLIAFLVASSAFELRQRAISAQAADASRQELIEDIRQRTGDAPVIFEAPHQLNVVWHYAKDLRGRLFLLDFEKGELGDDVSVFRIWSRDLAKQFVKFYDGPPLLGWSTVQRNRSIYIVPHPEAYKDEPAPDARYARYTMTPIHGQLHQLLRVDAQ